MLHSSHTLELTDYEQGYKDQIIYILYSNATILRAHKDFTNWDSDHYKGRCAAALKRVENRSNSTNNFKIFSDDIKKYKISK